MINNKTDKLVEATMLALQGKLPVKEARTSSKFRPKKDVKKTESIDVNVNDDTTVSVEGNETIVNTDDATVIVTKKDDEFTPEVCDGEVTEPVIDAPVETDEPVETVSADDTVEVPVDDTIMPDELLDEPVDTELPEEKEDEEDEEEAEPSIDEMVGESKQADVNEKEIAQKKARFIREENKRRVERVQRIVNARAKKLEAKKIQEEVDDEAYKIADKIAKKINKDGILHFTEVDDLICKLSSKSEEEISNSDFKNDVYGCLNYKGIDQNNSTGDFFTQEYAKEHPEVLEENKTKKSEALNKLNKSLAEFRKFNSMKKAKLENRKANVGKNAKLEVKKIQEDKYSDSTWYTYKINDTEYNFVCRSWENSRRWGHEVELKNGFSTIGRARCVYYNRTWESYEFQTCMLKAIDDAMKNDVTENMEELKEAVRNGRGLRESRNVVLSRKHKEVEAKKIAERKAKKEEAKKEEAKKETKSTNDLGIEQDIGKKVDPVPNTDTKPKETKVTKTERKFSSKTFNEVLTKFYSKKIKAVESVEVSKILKTAKGLKIEANMYTANNKLKRELCLELKQIQTGKSFDKYEVTEVKGIVTENKSNSTKTTLATFTNKQNIIECRYILCK